MCTDGTADSCDQVILRITFLIQKLFDEAESSFILTVTDRDRLPGRVICIFLHIFNKCLKGLFLPTYLLDHSQGTVFVYDQNWLDIQCFTDRS